LVAWWRPEAYQHLNPSTAKITDTVIIVNYHHVDGFATLDTSDRQRRIAGCEEAVGVPIFHTVT